MADVCTLCHSSSSRGRSILQRGVKAIIQRHNDDTHDYYREGEKEALSDGHKEYDQQVGFREPRGGGD